MTSCQPSHALHIRAHTQRANHIASRIDSSFGACLRTNLKAVEVGDHTNN